MDRQVKTPDETQQIIDDFAEELAAEIDDFDATEATYQVWFLGSKANGEPTDFECLLNEFDHSETAESYAEDVYDNLDKFKDRLDAANDGVTEVVDLVVETVVDFGDYDENVETIYRRKIAIK